MVKRNLIQAEVKLKVMKSIKIQTIAYPCSMAIEICPTAGGKMWSGLKSVQSSWTHKSRWVKARKPNRMCSLRSIWLADSKTVQELLSTIPKSASNYHLNRNNAHQIRIKYTSSSSNHHLKKQTLRSLQMASIVNQINRWCPREEKPVI